VGERWSELTFISFGLLGKLGEVDGVFTRLRHLEGLRVVR